MRVCIPSKRRPRTTRHEGVAIDITLLVGDSVWAPEVETALAEHQPDVIVVNAGAAQFLAGGPLTMDASGVAQVCRACPQAAVVAVHSEAFNHCNLSRPALRAALDADGLAGRVQISQDGETLSFAVKG